MKKEMTEKRKQLIAISSGLQQLVKIGAIDSVNDGLMDIYFQEEEKYPELNTFHGWKEKGRSVIKGAESYCFWGRPRKININDEKNKEETKENGFSFFPITYLFKESQTKGEDK